MRRAAKVDAGSQAIRDGLREHGVGVEVIGRPVDWVCGYKGRTYLLEVKAENARKRKDQPKQDAFIATWPGHVARVRTVAEALTACGVEQVARLIP